MYTYKRKIKLYREGNFDDEIFECEHEQNKILPLGHEEQSSACELLLAMHELDHAMQQLHFSRWKLPHPKNKTIIIHSRLEY